MSLLMKKLIEIRAHHLLCIPRFYRGGYNEQFSSNMKQICSIIRKNPDTNIKVIAKCDDLCRKCPHKHRNYCSQTPEIGKWVLSHDKKVLNYLKLKENSIHKARTIFNLAMNKVTQINISRICKGCIFLDNCIKVGINNSFKRDLNKNPRPANQN